MSSTLRKEMEGKWIPRSLIGKCEHKKIMRHSLAVSEKLCHHWCLSETGEGGPGEAGALPSP